MMGTLKNLTKNTVVANDLQQASTFYMRAKGLLGRSSMAPGEALWIDRCNSIHTWFMRFPIDVVFVDRHSRVKSIAREVHPWRFLFPRWGVRSVVEFPAGALEGVNIEPGDELYVGD